MKLHFFISRQYNIFSRHVPNKIITGKMNRKKTLSGINSSISMLAQAQSNSPFANHNTPPSYQNTNSSSVSTHSIIINPTQIKSNSTTKLSRSQNFNIIRRIARPNIFLFRRNLLKTYFYALLPMIGD